MTQSIRASGLGRVYVGPDGPIVALEPSDFTFNRGELVVLRGPSGSGKSTLLNLLGLLDRPTVGDLWIEGQHTNTLNARQLSDNRRRHLGFLFQDAGLIDRMSVFDNVRMPLDYRNFAESVRRERALLAIERVGLTNRKRAMVDTLSGGERQRTGLARVLAVRPDIVICDEPTASLDETNSRAVVEQLLDAAAGGACVVCASHDPIVLEGAHHRYSLARGRLTVDAASS